MLSRPAWAAKDSRVTLNSSAAALLAGRFDLPMPESPGAAIPWSPWLKPAPR